jgi:hypothetical protein
MWLRWRLRAVTTAAMPNAEQSRAKTTVVVALSPVWGITTSSTLTKVAVLSLQLAE